MNYSPLGSTTFSISRLGLGTVQLGMPYGVDAAQPPDDECCIALIRQALEAGINYLDTASAYGRSEELVGRACAGLAAQPIICTKVSLPDDLEPHALLDHIHSQLDNSRRLLNRDVLPLVKLHSQLGPFTFPALFEAMESLSVRGWVQHWGVTTYGASAPQHALNFPTIFRALQIPYSALDRGAEETLFARATARRVALVARSVFLQGILSDRFAVLPSVLDPLQPALDSLRGLAQQAGLSLAELALRYVSHQPAISSTLFGTTSIEEMHANLRFFANGPLPDDLSNAIRTVPISAPQLLNPSSWNKALNSSKARSSS